MAILNVNRHDVSLKWLYCAVGIFGVMGRRLYQKTGAHHE